MQECLYLSGIPTLSLGGGPGALKVPSPVNKVQSKQQDRGNILTRLKKRGKLDSTFLLLTFWQAWEWFCRQKCRLSARRAAGPLCFYYCYFSFSSLLQAKGAHLNWIYSTWRILSGQEAPHQASLCVILQGRLCCRGENSRRLPLAQGLL